MPTLAPTPTPLPTLAPTPMPPTTTRQDKSPWSPLRSVPHRRDSHALLRAALALAGVPPKARSLGL
eukprot:7196143-Pyramimonas_sp.AAC.1